MIKNNHLILRIVKKKSVDIPMDIAQIVASSQYFTSQINMYEVTAKIACMRDVAIHNIYLKYWR